MTAGYLLLNKKDNNAQDISKPSVKTNTNRVSPTQAVTAETTHPQTPEIQNQTNKYATQLQENTATESISATNSGIVRDVTETPKPSNEPVTTAIAVENKAEGQIIPKKEKKGQKANTTGKQIATVLANDNQVDKLEEIVSIDNQNENQTVKTEVVNKIVANEKISKNRDGSIHHISYDTIDKSIIEIEKKGTQTDLLAANTNTNKNYQYHPRYLGAQVDADETPIVLNNIVNSEPVVAMQTPGIKGTDEKPKSKKRQDNTSMFTALGAFASVTLNKIGDASGDFFRLFKTFDPGVSMGVNAALFKTKHNYGGFHAGLTNHTAISETFSVISDLKFFIRNNAGFTINDIKTQILNKSVDTTVPGQTTDFYQVDSLTKKYNFKSFMSLELPLMLSARFNKISIYGGPNFVYNFKLKINEIDKKYVVNKEEVVSNAVQFNYPAELGMKYAKNDFGNRFGIGYAVGVSYNFHPKIYIDLRMSKVVWDNTQTNSQREISNGVTKVPFTQLSLGYKFLEK
ncbi:MAG: outer membrane beta-barrel protein [Bacteroidetes bacterium]|nr:outer membrane beta-barrel protein [Bacteroidota bacterium]